jgi:membrane protein implicated in regulation of membrane protease activity
MRRAGLLTLAVVGGGVIVSAFLPYASKEGGNIAFEGGSIPADLGGLATYVGVAAGIAGILVILGAVFLGRSRFALGGISALIGAIAAILLGGLAVLAPEDFYVQLGALSVGAEADQVREVIVQFDQPVTAGLGAWIGLIAGAIAALVTILLAATVRNRIEAPSSTMPPPTTREARDAGSRDQVEVDRELPTPTHEPDVGSTSTWPRDESDPTPSGPEVQRLGEADSLTVDRIRDELEERLAGADEPASVADPPERAVGAAEKWSRPSFLDHPRGDIESSAGDAQQPKDPSSEVVSRGASSEAELHEEQPPDRPRLGDSWSG